MQTPSPPSAALHMLSADNSTQTNEAASFEKALSQLGEFATISQVLEAIDIDPSTHTMAILGLDAQALRLESRTRCRLYDAGWERGKKVIDGVRVWGYIRPASSYTAKARLSSDNSRKMASTSAVLEELNTALDNAIAVCKRSKAAIAMLMEPCGTSSSACSSFSRTSKASSASLDSVSSMDFPQLLSKDTHGKSTLDSVGGAA